MSEPNDADRALLAALRELSHLDSMAALPLIAAHRELANDAGRTEALREVITYVSEQSGPEAMSIGWRLQHKFQVKLPECGEYVASGGVRAHCSRPAGHTGTCR